MAETAYSWNTQCYVGKWPFLEQAEFIQRHQLVTRILARIYTQMVTGTDIKIETLVWNNSTNRFSRDAIWTIEIGRMLAYHSGYSQTK